MDFCPECGGMIINGTRCHLCGYDINGFNFRNLKIGVPKKFISDYSQFKNNYSKLLDLILNKNQIFFTKDDILENYREIIDVANENLINNKKKIILNEFRNEINSNVDFIDENKRLFFKSKFNRDYFSYYDNLGFDKEIDKFNSNFIEKRKKEIYIEFHNDLKSFDKIITEEDIEKFKLKYVEYGFDFFTFLNMEKEIIEFNEKFYKKQINEAFNILRTNYSNLNSIISREILLELKLNYPNIDWDIIVQKYNRQFYKKKFESHKTTDGVYYLHDYIRKDDWEFSNPDQVKISKQILNYKNGINKAVVHFTNELIGFIEEFVEYELQSNIKKIFLVSIPSSTWARDKNSPMKKTIKIIVDKSEKSLINLTNHQEIINLSDLLYRKIDITASHIKRQSYETHIKTIELNKSNLNDADDGVYIIMDDITTTGNVMDACTDILIKNGIDSERIYKVVIAATG